MSFNIFITHSIDENNFGNFGGGAKNNVINFGFNDNNKPVTGTECPTKLQLEWQAVTLSGSNYIKL
jgi:hypothetical protein